MNSPNFPAKLLLFGEYSIIQGGQALALPLRLFEAAWKWGDKNASNNDYYQKLLDFTAYLEASTLSKDINHQVFRQDLNEGLYFDSTIPQGYGLGSSGALCAAVYQRYGLQKTTHLGNLKTLFAQMESFFHGASSGIDPLVAYLQKPLLVNSREAREEGAAALFSPDVATAPQSSAFSLFLLDTGRERQTGPLVQQFLKDCEDSHYLQRLEAQYMPVVEEAIEAFIRQDQSLLWSAFHQISHFQYQYFSAMIPQDLLNLWLNGLAQGSYRLKLCGAGGGGFMLGMSTDWKACQEVLHPYQLLSLSPQ
ncbi:MAG: mevalonate kinase [Bacteroidota bacterium]